MSNNTNTIPELNLRVILIGVALSIVMGSANVYLGLKAGMTVSASIPAAVMGMLVLKYIGIFSRKSKPGSILEANQIQTACYFPHLVFGLSWKYARALKSVTMHSSFCTGPRDVSGWSPMMYAGDETFNFVICQLCLE